MGPLAFPELPRPIMKAFALAAALVLSSAPAAFAQTAPAAKPAGAAAADPERLKLAREVFESTGGVETMRAQMQGMNSGMQTMMKSLSATLSPAMSKDIFDFMQKQEEQMIPEMMESAVQAYARHLTTDELKAMIAWNKSPAAQSIRSKMPAVTQEMMAAQGPEMQRMTRAMAGHMVELICQQQHCTADQKRQLDEIMAKQFGASI